LTPGEAGDEMTRQLKEIQAKQSSFMPHFIATLAALKGDFRPAFQLQEQKMKTAAALGVMPLIAKARSKALQGDIEGSTSDLNRIAEGLGPYNPEMSALLQKGIEQQILTQRQLISEKGAIGSMKAKLADMPEDVQNRYKSTIAWFEGENKAGRPIGKETTDRLLQEMSPKYQIIGDQIYTETPTGITAHPIEAITKESAVNTPVGLAFAAQNNMTVPVLTNTLNAITRGDLKGPQAEQLMKNWVDLQQVQARIGLMEKMPIDPQARFAWLAQSGVWNAAQGIITKPEAWGILQDAARRQAMVTGATGREAQQVQLEHPLTFQRENQVLVDVSPNISQFAKNYSGRMLSAQDVQALRGRGVNLEPMDRTLWQNEVQPDMMALRDLGYIQEVFKAYGDPTTLFDRTRTGVGRMLGNYIGASLTPGMTAGAVAELLANRAIERLGRTQQIDVREVGDLKRLMSGPWANKAEALAAIPLLQQKLVDRIEMNTGHRVSVEPAQSGAPLHDVPAVPETAPQGGPEGAAGTTSPPYSIRTKKGEPPIKKGDVNKAIERYTREKQGLPPSPSQEEAPPTAPTAVPAPAAPPGPTEITITPGKPVSRR